LYLGGRELKSSNDHVLYFCCFKVKRIFFRNLSEFEVSKLQIWDYGIKIGQNLIQNCKKCQKFIWCVPNGLVENIGKNEFHGLISTLQSDYDLIYKIFNFYRLEAFSKVKINKIQNIFFNRFYHVFLFPKYSSHVKSL
jgi:hypothetical protein